MLITRGVAQGQSVGFGSRRSEYRNFPPRPFNLNPNNTKQPNPKLKKLHVPVSDRQAEVAMVGETRHANGKSWKRSGFPNYSQGYPSLKPRISG